VVVDAFTMLDVVDVVDVGEEGGTDKFARGAEEPEQGRGLGALDDNLVDGGTIWNLGIGTLERSLDGCEGVSLVHEARIVRMNRISCGSSFDSISSPCAR